MLTKKQIQNILFLLLVIGVIIGLGFLIKRAVNKNKFEIPAIYNSSSIVAVANSINYTSVDFSKYPNNLSTVNVLDIPPADILKLSSLQATSIRIGPMNTGLDQLNALNSRQDLTYDQDTQVRRNIEYITKREIIGMTPSTAFAIMNFRPKDTAKYRAQLKIAADKYVVNYMITPSKFIVDYMITPMPYRGMVITAFGIAPDGEGYATVIDDKTEIYTNPLQEMARRWNPPVKSISNIYGGLHGEIAMSINGKYQLASAPNGSCMLSSDTGASWHSFCGLGPTLSFGQTAMSLDGKIQAVTFINGILISRDYGMTLSKSEPFTGLPLDQKYAGQYIKISSSGQYWIITYKNRLTYDQSSIIMVSNDYGKSWKSPSTFSNRFYMRSIEMSSDGKYQAAILYGGSTMLSSDYGATWAVQNYPGGTNMLKFCNKGIGQYRVSSSNDIFNSVDYGKTWLKATGYPSKPVKYFMVGERCSGTMVVTQDNIIYNSYNWDLRHFIM